MLTVVGWPTTTGDAGRGVHRRDSTDAARRCLWTGAGKSHPPNMRLPPPRRQQSGEHKHGILDRFIPPRSLQSNESRLSVLPDAHRTDGAPQSILEKDLKSERRFAYRRLLGTALFGERRCVRVLPLGLGAADGAEASLEHVEVDDRQDWPVRARRDPLVGAPELTVCMPELPKVPGSRGSRARMDQLMSWGACGVLAVAGRFGVYLWRQPVETNLPGTAGGSERSELLVSFGDDNNPMSLCWSPSPDRALLAIGTGRSSLVQMWDCDLKRELFSRRLPGPLASINAISWHPYEDIIAMGSYSGIVYVVTPSLSVLKFIRVFDREHGGVSAMSFSPDGLLLACGGMMGTALVWDWETGVVRGDEVDYRSPITSLSWHPWRSSVVALGTLAGQIALLNFSSRRTTTATYQGAKNQQVSVTALSFSERTAELVVAFSGKGVSQVAVLSDLTTVVDRIKAHQDSVNYICWSPDGAILATAGMDETLCVWNFLGAKTTKELRRRALQESREDRSGVRRQFGCIIR